MWGQLQRILTVRDCPVGVCLKCRVTHSLVVLSQEQWAMEKAKLRARLAWPNHEAPCSCSSRISPGRGSCTKNAMEVAPCEVGRNRTIHLLLSQPFLADPSRVFQRG